jgi:NAD(P)-dependent dehydrogenase (short-subunit alcohol dehydrogenase family)
MKSIVVTGSTRGIGRGLVEEFLKRDCKVVVAGRNQAQVDSVVAELGAQYGADKVTGRACEITIIDDVVALWAHAKEAYGDIDVWVNNAGISLPTKPIWEHKPEDLAQIASVNLGAVLAINSVVIGAMIRQGGGQVWNMEGFGSDGRAQSGMTPYGSTKRAIRYMNKSLQKEVADTNVQVCTLSPGMVTTDMLVGDYDRDSAEWERIKRIFNILADKVETVVPFLADGILAANKNGATVAWLTTGKVLGRFLTAKFKSRDLFAGQ